MNKKIKIGNNGIITLTDKCYLAAGGEATIYVNGGKTFKIYHDINKTLPAKKIQELSAIHNSQVITPQDLIYDATTGQPLGYTSNYIDNAEPLVKLFAKTFKTNNNISQAMLVELVKQLQLTTNDIHSAKCLIVDFNELNVLVNINNNTLTPWFIDTDSYATPSFKSTAVMDSIRDRRVSKIINGVLHYYPDEMSDWFSFGILAFYLYIGCHPFRGCHKNYKPRDKAKQFDDGISVFHKDVKMPPCTNDFLTAVPTRQQSWFIDTFRDGHRSIPPLPDSLMPLTVPAPIINITGNKEIEITQVASYSERIHSVIQSMGMNYVVSAKKIYRNDQELYSGCERYKKVLLCPASDGTIVMAILMNNMVTFIDLIRQQTLGTTSSSNMFFRNNCIYTIHNGKLAENKFTTMGNRILHRITEIENVSELSTVMYNGCAIQNLFGKYYLVLPYAVGNSFSKYLPQLDGYRVISAKAERNVVVILAEKNGQYDRFVVVFTKKDFGEFNVRKIDDVNYDTINMTVMENGLTLLLASPDELELFVNNNSIQVIKDPPFDSAMTLYNNADGVLFINGNSIHRVKRK